MRNNNKNVIFYDIIVKAVFSYFLYIGSLFYHYTDHRKLIINTFVGFTAIISFKACIINT